MPVKLTQSSAQESQARIEIVPLIDVMFFLLAAFMLATLSMANLNTVKMDLPQVTTAKTDAKKDSLSISVDKAGAIYLEKQLLSPNEMAAALTAWHKTNANGRVFISGDEDARYGALAHTLDLVRASGIDKAAFVVAKPVP